MLEAQGLHPPEARQQHDPDRAEARRVLTSSHHLPHHLDERANLFGTQPAFDLPRRHLTHARGRILLDDAKPFRVSEQRPEGADRPCRDAGLSSERPRRPRAALPAAMSARNAPTSPNLRLLAGRGPGSGLL